MNITAKLKQQLKARAHALNPIVLVGNKGISKELLLETDRALHDHELIKIRVTGNNKSERRVMLNDIADQLNASVIQLIGNVGVLYRAKSE